MNQHPIWKHIDENADRLRALSDNVWAVPETCYGEHKSVALHIEELETQGFRVEKEAAGIPTAVIGEAGSGGPVIGFLGNMMHWPNLVRWQTCPNNRHWKRGPMGMGVVTTCWDLRPCWRQSP